MTNLGAWVGPVIAYGVSDDDGIVYMCDCGHSFEPNGPTISMADLIEHHERHKSLCHRA